MSISKMNKELIGITLLSTFFTVLGVNHGLDNSVGGPALWSDETHFMRSTLNIAQGMNGYYNGFYVSFLYYYLAFIAVAVRLVLGFMGGRYHSIEDIRMEFFSEPNSLYLSGRLVAVVFTVLLVVGTFYMLRKMVNRKVAWAAALLLLFDITVQKYAIIMRLEGTFLFFFLLTFYACYRLVERQGDTHPQKLLGGYIFAGIAAGLTFSIKYNGMFVILAVVATHVWLNLRQPRKWLSLNLVAAFAAFLITFVVLNYFLFSSVDRFMANFAYGALQKGATVSHRVNTTGSDHTWINILTYALPEYLGVSFYLLFLGSLLAGVYLLRKGIPAGSGRNMLVLSYLFLLTYYLPIGYFNRCWDRDIMPLIPFMYIGYVLVAWFGLQGVIANEKIQGIVFGLLVVLPLGINLWRSVDYKLACLQPDPRNLANEWLQQTAENGNTIYQNTEIHGVPLPMTAEYYSGLYEATRGKQMKYLLDMARHDTLTKRFNLQANWNEADYVLISSRSSSRVHTNYLTKRTIFPSRSYYIPAITVYTGR